MQEDDDWARPSAFVEEGTTVDGGVPCIDRLLLLAAGWCTSRRSAVARRETARDGERSE